LERFASCFGSRQEIVAQAGQKAVFHYDAGPRVKVRFTTFAAAGLDIETCPETNNALLPETEVLPMC
jgi:hypothetical protein